MNKKKYKVSYTSGATGFGWEDGFDTIQQVEFCLTNIKNDYTAQVYVFDYELNDFVFYKNCLTFEFDIDFIFTNSKRDLRTTSRLVKS